MENSKKETLESIIDEAYQMYSSYMESSRKIIENFEEQNFPRNEETKREKFENFFNQSSISYCNIKATQCYNIEFELKKNEYDYSQKIRGLIVIYRKALTQELIESLIYLDNIKEELESYIDSGSLNELNELVNNIINSNFSCIELRKVKKLLNIPITKENDTLTKIQNLTNELIRSE